MMKANKKVTVSELVHQLLKGATIYAVLMEEDYTQWAVGQPAYDAWATWRSQWPEMEDEAIDIRFKAFVCADKHHEALVHAQSFLK